MLQSNLDRSGVPLAIDGNLIYADVTTRRVGINTDSPAYSIDSPGNVRLANIIILANTITSNTGVIGLGSNTNVSITGGNNYDVIYTNGSGALKFGNVGSLPDLVAANAAIVSINANLGAYQTWANANAATQATSIDTITANVGILYLGNISTNANLGSYQAWANATFATATTENQLDANVGAYQTWANANIGTLYLGNISTNANLGTYQIWANANAATQATSINTINANLGAYQTFANANVSSLQNQITGANTAIQTLNANIGAFETYANLYLGTAAYGNANVAVYLPTYTGNLSPGNVFSQLYGNISTDYISANTSNIVTFTGTGAVAMPVGTTGNRPTGSAGYVRYNTDTPALEYYDGTNWIPVTNTVLDQQISPDGTSSVYTLDQEATTIGIIVSINGVLQRPTSAYTVSSNQITFTETPADSDIIDVRFLGAAVTINSTLTDDLTVSGNLTVQGNVTLSGILSAPQATKASNATGTVGQICWDSNYIYVCTAANTWKRSPLTGGY